MLNVIEPESKRVQPVQSCGRIWRFWGLFANFCHESWL